VCNTGQFGKKSGRDDVDDDVTELLMLLRCFWLIRLSLITSLSYAAVALWTYFWANVCKTVRPMLSDRCPVCLSVCNVGVLWPNGWMYQDETCMARR